MALRRFQNVYALLEMFGNSQNFCYKDNLKFDHNYAMFLTEGISKLRKMYWSFWNFS